MTASRDAIGDRRLIQGAAMNYSGMNTIAILIAAIAGWLFGAVWYGVLGKQWMAALGKTQADLRPDGKMPVLPMILSVAADIVMAFFLAGLIAHLGPGHVTTRGGIISGVLVWIGFVITTMIVNNSFARHDRRLLLIDGGHWLFVLIIMGGIIGAFSR
jgi:hypothetical protein